MENFKLLLSALVSFSIILNIVFVGGAYILFHQQPTNMDIWVMIVLTGASIESILRESKK